MRLQNCKAEFCQSWIIRYRLLQEYFALPHRFLFVEFAELSRAVKRCDGQELELIVLFDRHEPSLEGSVGAAQFLPFCTPAINLFPKRVDRIHLPDRVNEHHVIADRTRPMDFEIHSLSGITGHGTGLWRRMSRRMASACSCLPCSSSLRASFCQSSP